MRRLLSLDLTVLSPAVEEGDPADGAEAGGEGEEGFY